MASSLVARAVRRAATVTRLSSPPSSAQATSLVQRRGLAGALTHGDASRKSGYEQLFLLNPPPLTADEPLLSLPLLSRNRRRRQNGR
ncbi:hypothetical protein RHGRI_021997 [Rhododendron griersonianum]|uniref:Uncharacterized protein n=1 Tax=Rhododendron griersonianum TaxID=479676 RepID=A0AAV6JRV5_9ERIC|nr:hypothetical protein RHGRI_021997 [Rhododendron griersonianum]